MASNDYHTCKLNKHTPFLNIENLAIGNKFKIIIMM